MVFGSAPNLEAAFGLVRCSLIEPAARVGREHQTPQVIALPGVDLDDVLALVQVKGRVRSAAVFRSGTPVLASVSKAKHDVIDKRTSPKHDSRYHVLVLRGDRSLDG